MKTYQVVIQRHVIYEIQAESEHEAEELAFCRERLDDYSEPLLAEVLDVEALPCST